MFQRLGAETEDNYSSNVSVDSRNKQHIRTTLSQPNSIVRAVYTVCGVSLRNVTYVKCFSNKSSITTVITSNSFRK